MERIKAYVDYNDENKTHYYQMFEVADHLPELEDNLIINEKFKDYNYLVKDIEIVDLDCEQGSEEVNNYNYYKIIYFNNDDYYNYNYDLNECYSYKYVAIKKSEE